MSIAFLRFKVKVRGEGQTSKLKVKGQNAAGNALILSSILDRSHSFIVGILQSVSSPVYFTHHSQLSSLYKANCYRHIPLHVSATGLSNGQFTPTDETQLDGRVASRRCELAIIVGLIRRFYT